MCSPGEGKASCFGRPEDVQHVAVGRQDREADVLKDRVWRAQLQEQHDENSVVRDLREREHGINFSLRGADPQRNLRGLEPKDRRLSF